MYCTGTGTGTHTNQKTNIRRFKIGCTRTEKAETYYKEEGGTNALPLPQNPIKSKDQGAQILATLRANAFLWSRQEGHALRQLVLGSPADGAAVPFFCI